ncbi:hypothetical protein GCM10010255_79440 [Streptomyces coeruleofuscus]|uniref:Uncharacterized protein n=1 Tax=Streptomyces coeruleofuscus TaxID=66879 RepID=A0ABN3JC39_9ACTN
MPPDLAEGEDRFEDGKVRDEVSFRVLLRVRPPPVCDGTQPRGQLMSLVYQQTRVGEGPAGRRSGDFGPDDEPVVVPAVSVYRRRPACLPRPRGRAAARTALSGDLFPV